MTIFLKLIYPRNSWCIILSCWTALALVPSCTQERSNSQITQERLYQLFEREWEFRLKENPVFATSMGVHSANDRLPAVSERDQRRRADFRRNLLAQLEEIDTKQLDETDKINYQLFRFLQEDAIAQFENKAYLIPINAEGGFYSSFPFIIDRMPFHSVEDYKNYLARLAAFSQYTDAHITLMRKGIEQGYMPPKVILKGYESGILMHRDALIEESVFYKPFLQLPTSVSAVDKIELQELARKVIRDSVAMSYGRLADFMATEYVPTARETLGASELPNGEAWYDQRVKFFTTLPYTAEEIFQIGQLEVRRIRREMDSLMRSTGFKGDFASFLEFLRTDKQFYASSPREFLMHASYWSKKIDGRLPEFFHPLPRSPYGVEPVPAAIAPKYTGGRYVPGSYENHRSGTYWVNTYKLGSRPLYVLPALTLHEAVPGHHLQNAFAEELEGFPEFRRQTYLSCYGEGWALYCELLGKEMGIYETPYEEFGRMTYEMWRACRLVVDVGLHAKGWSRQQAIDFLASNTALSLHEVGTEIDRYIGWPGQALSYKVGELKIRELRQLAEEELGDAFDLHEFHRVILSQGAVPLFILEEMVESYIEEK
ncbi:MAG: DUF885 domain-containing protein [Bacteroidota bacterium]